MNIVFFGDSITDAGRNYSADFRGDSYGMGYVFDVYSDLLLKNPTKYKVYNRGINGNRVVDLYARIKCDLWNLKPDVISIYIGVNDVWHEIGKQNGVEIDRFETVYKMMIEDTIKVLPNAQIILIEPFVLNGKATAERFEDFLEVRKYAKVVQKIAKEYNLHFIALQDKMDALAKEYGVGACSTDGVHPNVFGARIIANEWLKLYNEKIKEV